MKEQITDSITNKENNDSKFHGKIDFYSMTGQVMETLYYENEKEFNKEIEDSHEVGRPIKSQKLSVNNVKEPLKESEKSQNNVINMGNNEKMEDILKNLEQGVKDVFTSNKFKEYLDVMSRFHKYSPNNILMIMMQKPDAEQVAGYNTWKVLDRQVQKGQKAIKILAPCSFKKEVPATDENGNQEIDEKGNPKTEKKEIRYFKLVNVFDINQTEGKALPSLITELKGNVEEKESIYKALNRITGLEIQEKGIKGKAKGYYRPGENPEIVVRKGMSDLQSIKTGVHETAHCLLHDPQKDNLGSTDSRSTQEVEAEAVAYVVLSKLGLDTSDYSFGYIASWSADKQLQELKQSLDTIQKTANKIYSEIENEIGHLQSIDKVIAEKTQDKTTVDIVWTESWEDKDVFFKTGDLLDIKEANNKYKEYDDKVVRLKNEAKSKGEYYPYTKTKFNIKTQIDGKETNYTGRYDIGDGKGYLLDHIKNSLKDLKKHSETVTKDIVRKTVNKEINFIEKKLLPKLDKDIKKESITKRLQMAKEKNMTSKNPKAKERER